MKIDQGIRPVMRFWMGLLWFCGVALLSQPVIAAQRANIQSSQAELLQMFHDLAASLTEQFRNSGDNELANLFERYITYSKEHKQESLVHNSDDMLLPLLESEVQTLTSLKKLYKLANDEDKDIDHAMVKQAVRQAYIKVVLLPFIIDSTLLEMLFNLKHEAQVQQITARTRKK